MLFLLVIFSSYLSQFFCEMEHFAIMRAVVKILYEYVHKCASEDRRNVFLDVMEDFTDPSRNLGSIIHWTPESFTMVSTYALRGSRVTLLTFNLLNRFFLYLPYALELSYLFEQYSGKEILLTSCYFGCNWQQRHLSFRGNCISPLKLSLPFSLMDNSF